MSDEIQDINPNPSEVETPAPAEEIAESAPAESGDSPAEQEKERQNGVQKRINELTRQREEERRRAEYWAQVAQERAAAQQPQTPNITTNTQLSVDNFNTYEEFMQALAQQEAMKIVERQRQIEAQQVKQQELAVQRQRFQSQQAEAIAKYADFEEVVNNPSIPVTPAMVDGIMDSDMSGDVMYYLGKHPDEARKMAGMTPTAVLREIGKIEAKLTIKPPTKLPGAPPPPSTIGNKQNAGIDPEKLSMEEYCKWRDGKL